MRAQAVLVVVGLWLMAAPAVLGYDGAAADSDRIAGPLLAALSFLAAFQITRGLRWLSVPVGAWLVAAPIVLGFPIEPAISSVACGVAALALAPRGAPDQSRYGGGWASLRGRRSLPGVGDRRSQQAD